MRNVHNLFLLVFILGAIFTGNVNAQTNGNNTKSTQTSTKGNAGKVINLTKAEFLKQIYNYEKNPQKWTYEGNKPCIIDFYATWCGPCKKVSPILDELAKTYKDQIVIYKIDVDKEKKLATDFGIQSIPSLLFVPKNGTPRMSQGALSKEEFINQIETFLLEKKKP